jgi:hypothetical protein
MYQPNEIFISQMKYQPIIYQPKMYQPNEIFISQLKYTCIYQPNSGVAGVPSQVRVGQIIT